MDHIAITFVLTMLLGLFTMAMATLFAVCLNAGEPVVLASVEPASTPSRKARPTLHSIPRITGYARPTYLLPTTLVSGEYAGRMASELVYCAPGIVDCEATDRCMYRDSASTRYRQTVRRLGGAGTIWAHSDSARAA